MCVELSGLRGGMRCFAESFDAAVVSAADAARVVEHASVIEKMAAAVKAAAAARVADTGAWKKHGHRSPAHHLAATCGSSLGQAQITLETARRLAQLPEASAAARRGELSAAQASAVANAASADPGAERSLVEKARRASLSDLREECARTKAAADPDLEARRRRIHARRSLRRWHDTEGVFHTHWADNPEVGAAFAAVLDPIIEELFATARAEGRREPHEAYSADAMAELARRAAGASSAAAGAGGAGKGGSAGASGEGGASDDNGDDESHGTAPEPDAGSGAAPAPAPSRPRISATKILVRVDFGALFRGYPTTGETCEIVGFGPVAVSAIRDLIDTGDPFLAAIVTHGEKVLGVAHLGRRPTAAQQSALQWIQPRCANEACPNLAGLEYDHRHDWATTHVTLFDALDRLCTCDHDNKTRENWSLVEGSGRRAFVPPDDPRHPRNAGGGAGAQRPPPAADNDPPEAA